MAKTCRGRTDRQRLVVGAGVEAVGTQCRDVFLVQQVGDVELDFGPLQVVGGGADA